RDGSPWYFQIYQGFNVILTNSQTSHVLHLALLAWCVMDKLAVLLGTRRTVGLALNASRDMFNISVGFARTLGFARALGKAAGRS
ncbi:hypothetical protein, partial [Pseudomonas ficuserectae]